LLDDQNIHGKCDKKILHTHTLVRLMRHQAKRDILSLRLCYHIIEHGTVYRKTNWWGMDMDMEKIWHLSTLFTTSGYVPTGIVCDIKEKLSYVAQDYDEELSKADTSSELEQNYELYLMGQVISPLELWNVSDVLKFCLNQT